MIIGYLQDLLIGKYINGYKIVKIEYDPFVKGQINLITDGEIIEQSTKEGEKLSKGDTITLYIPDIVSKYPNFTDGSYTIEEIQKFCEEYGVTLETKEEIREGVEEGTIVAQSKPEGYVIRAGTKLIITIAKSGTGDAGETCTDEQRELGQCE